jgi:hypothetical protein
MIPAVDSLLPKPYNTQLLVLLYRLAEWHALAKLRMHSEDTLQHLEKVTKVIGCELRTFQDWTKSAFKCKELPSESSRRSRNQQRRKARAAKSGNAPPSITPDPPKTQQQSAKAKSFSLHTYKNHALGDYVQTIRLFGTTDSYSTQTVRNLLLALCHHSPDFQGELAHRFVKHLYSRTNKNNALKQIAKNERRSTRLQHAREAAAAHYQHIHHVQFSDNDPLPYTGFYEHHHLSDSTNFPLNLMAFVNQPPNDPAKAVGFTTFAVSLS